MLTALARLEKRVAVLEQVQEQRQHELTVCLAEYSRLATEQNGRLQLRDNLALGTIVGLATIVTAIVQLGTVLALLVLPPALYVVCHVASNNDRIISLIGDYLGGLGTRLDRLASTTGLLSWDRGYRAKPGRTLRKVAQLLANLILFLVPAVGALAAVWWLSLPSPLLLAACAVEAVLCLSIAAMLLTRAELWLRRATG